LNNLKNISCPCGSQEKYMKCCKIYHDGKNPDNALKLMKSRYSAYAFSKSEYIIKTTHPLSSHFQKDKNLWENEILRFSTETSFDALEILSFDEDKEEAYVTFIAHLTQDENDITFSEKSHFLLVEGQWLYVKGVISSAQDKT
jgi:SEC-C motif domain protein